MPRVSIAIDRIRTPWTAPRSERPRTCAVSGVTPAGAAAGTDAESGATSCATPAAGAPSRAHAIRVANRRRAGRSATFRRAEALTCELRLARIRESLDELFQMFFRVAGLAELVLAQCQLVEPGRRAIAVRMIAHHRAVFGRGTVELGQGEEPLARAVARVVSQLGGRERTQEVAESLDRDRVAALGEILGRLVVDLVGIPGRSGIAGRRLALGLLRETPQRLAEALVETAHLVEQLLGGAAGGGAGAEQDVLLLRNVRAHRRDQLVAGLVPYLQRIDHHAETVETRLHLHQARRVTARQRPRGEHQNDPHHAVHADRAVRRHVRTRKWARRFCDHALSSWPSANGRSLPYEITLTRSADTPCATM